MKMRLRNVSPVVFALAAALPLAAAGEESSYGSDDSADSVVNLATFPYSSSLTQTAEAQAFDEPARLILAQTSMPGGRSDKTSAAEPPSELKVRWFTRNKLHQYLGIGSIGSATLAILSPKEEGGAHEHFAEGAMGLGALAVLTGLGFHYEDLSIRNGLRNPDNWHAILGTLGTLGFAHAVDEAPASGHSGSGVAGYLSMAAAIKLTW